jgi:hypothetical protein
MIGSVTVSSTVVTRFASLDNTQETTGSTSTGKGGGVLTVDTTTGKIAGFLVHNVADATRAHIHLGTRGVAGGIRVNLTPVDLPSATMYTVPDNTFFPNPAADVASFLAGDLYFNVHNPAFPAGVIRGQIDMTPTSIRFASLDNTQETTGSDSTGKGGGLIAVDEATGRLAGFLVHNVADATRAHIHLGARGVAGGIRVNLTPVDLPSATMYAVPDNTFFPNPAADVASYLAGNLYLNVHNPAFPAGVIRGQIDMTPTSIRFASLDNTQETTGSNSTGKGGGLLAVDEAAGKIAGFLVHNVADATRAHIHLGARGVAGGIRVNLTPVDLPSATMYTVPDNTFFPTPAADVASYLAGNLYLNVHNPAFPGGVIRGQIDFP